MDHKENKLIEQKHDSSIGWLAGWLAALHIKLSFLRLIIYWIMIFPCNSIVRNVRNSKFNEMYMELCKELSPFVGISVTEIYECAYLQ